MQQGSLEMQFAVAVLAFAVGAALGLPVAAEKRLANPVATCPRCAAPSRAQLKKKILSLVLGNLLVLYSQLGQCKRCYISSKTLGT
jgi:hypothetical protein